MIREVPRTSVSGEHPGTVANAFMGNFSFTCNNCCLGSHRSVTDGLTGFLSHALEVTALMCRRMRRAACSCASCLPRTAFPRGKCCWGNSCFSTAHFFNSCKVAVDWLAVRALAWLHNATPRLQHQDEYFPPLMGNYSAQRVLVINHHKSRQAMLSDPSFCNQ